MQEHDGHGFSSAYSLREALELVAIDRSDVSSLDVHPPCDADPMLAIHKRGRAMADKGIQLRPILPTDFDHVLETPIRDQRNAGTGALQESVGRDCRSEDHAALPVRFTTEDPTETLEHRCRRIIRS